LNVDLPEVQGFNLRPRFYREGNSDYVEISAIGTRDTDIKKVTPDVMERWPSEWAAYCDGRPVLPRSGTPLTALSQMGADQAKKLFDGNVQVLEELAVLSDAQAGAFGHGTITLRTLAQKFLAKQESDRKVEVQNKITAAAASPVPVAEANPEAFAKIGAAIDGLSSKIDQLVNILIAQNAPKQRGRPPKDKNGPPNSP